LVDSSTVKVDTTLKKKLDTTILEKKIPTTSEEKKWDRWERRKENNRKKYDDLTLAILIFHVIKS